jgi:hypothetical protein
LYFCARNFREPIGIFLTQLPSYFTERFERKPDKLRYLKVSNDAEGRKESGALFSLNSNLLRFPFNFPQIYFFTDSRLFGLSEVFLREFLINSW